MPLQSLGLSRKSAQQLIHAPCNALPVQLQVAKYVVLRPMPKAQRQMTHTTLTLSSVVVNRSTAKCKRTKAANGHDQCYHGHMGIGHKPCSNTINNTT